MSKLPKATRAGKAAPADSDDAPPASVSKGRTKGKADKGPTSGGVIGFEEKLWLAADKLRGSMDPGEYKRTLVEMIEPTRGRVCKSATLAEIAAHDFVLTPGRYVGAEDVEDDGEPFDAKMKRLVGELEGQLAEGARLDGEIRKNLRGLGYGR
jgi:type I restriction-modification system DNA methylase subunit